MTKEIIIDGCNVAECEYAILPKNQCPAKSMPYAKETSCIACKEHNTKLNFCKNNPDCYFKQLKRLEKENEELKKEFEQYKRYKFLFEKAKKLKGKTDKWARNCLKENEDLKDTIKRFVCQAECYKHKEAHKYKQTLEEIREIAKDNINCESDKLPCPQSQDILNKINEILNEK